MSDVRVGDAVRNNPVILDQSFTGHWSRKSMHFTAKITCKVLHFYTWFCGGLGITFEHRHTKSLRALHYAAEYGFFPFLPHLVELEILKGNCKKQNLRFKSTTVLEGSCIFLRDWRMNKLCLLKADFSCPVVMKPFVAVTFVGHLEFALHAENSKTCQSYKTHPPKDGEQCHIQQALLCP